MNLEISAPTQIHDSTPLVRTFVGASPSDQTFEPELKFQDDGHIVGSVALTIPDAVGKTLQVRVYLGSGVVVTRELQIGAAGP